MIWRVPLFVLLLFAAPLSAQEPGGAARIEEILDGLASPDPFTVYEAGVALDDWAARTPQADEMLERLREGSGKKRVEILDIAIRRVALAGRAAGKTRDAILDDILSRLGSEEESISLDAAADIDNWILALGDDAQPQFEARGNGASDQIQRGIRLATERILQVGPALALQRSAVAGDELRAWTRLSEINGPSGLKSSKAQEDVDRWICTDPETVQRLMAGYQTHPKRGIAISARTAVAKATSIVDWLPALHALDRLGLPSVARANRVRLRDPEAVQLPRMPGREWQSPGAWALDRQQPRGRLLFDDGCVRSGRYSTETAVFPGETWSYLVPGDPPPYPDGPEGFWRAVLFARWALELRLLNEATGCLQGARKLSNGLWPDESSDKLAGRILRMGADFLIRQGQEHPRDDDAGVMWKRLGDVPLDDCRNLARPEIARWKRVDEGSVRWRDKNLAEVQAFPVAEQVEYWTWRVLARESELLAAEKVGSFLEEVSGELKSTEEPMAGMASLPWEAVPFLIEGLGDSTPTAQWIEGRRVLVSDAVRFALARHLGPETVPMTWDSRMKGSWNETKDNPEDVQARATAKWNRFAGMNEEERGWTSWRDAGCPGCDWVLQREPALCLDKCWAYVSQLEEDSRKRAIASARIRNSLRRAPREKVEALLPTTSGELKEVVRAALEPLEPAK